MAKRIFSLTAVCLLGFMLLPAGNKSTQTLSAPDAPAREATSGEDMGNLVAARLRSADDTL